jgi:RHS repeat-associated protein
VRVDKPTGTRSFVYDADGRVMGEYGTSASDVKAEFIWALPSLAANDNSPFGGGDVIGGYTPLAVASPSGSGPGPVELFWVHGNHLGVPVVYTNASGTAVAPPGDYLMPGFPGQARVMADLYYNRYRDYDPVTGRYIQVDPIGLGGGANSYIYAGANPVNRIDPDGRFWWLAGAVIGGGANLAYQLYNNGGNWECVEWWNVADWAMLGSGAGELAGLTWKFGGRKLLFEILEDTTGAVPNRIPTKLRPMDDAVGPHSTFRKDTSGLITDYANYEWNPAAKIFVPFKRFKGKGSSHGGMDPPFILEPKPGKGVGAPPKEPRTPEPWELPKGY